jgi:hypothetical protein
MLTAARCQRCRKPHGPFRQRSCSAAYFERSLRRFLSFARSFSATAFLGALCAFSDPHAWAPAIFSDKFDPGLFEREQETGCDARSFQIPLRLQPIGHDFLNKLRHRASVVFGRFFEPRPNIVVEANAEGRPAIRGFLGSFCHHIFCSLLTFCRARCI